MPRLTGIQGSPLPNGSTEPLRPKSDPASGRTPAHPSQLSSRPPALLGTDTPRPRVSLPTAELSPQEVEKQVRNFVENFAAKTCQSSMEAAKTDMDKLFNKSEDEDDEDVDPDD